MTPGEAYRDIMDRTSDQPNQPKTIATTALMWLTYAKERLHAEVVFDAIAAELNVQVTEIDSYDLVESCRSLVLLDSQTGRIWLAHETARSYLEGKFNKKDAEVSMAKRCMEFLNTTPFDMLSATSDGLGGYPGRHWAEHVREVEQELIHDVGDLLPFEFLVSRERRDLALKLAGPFAPVEYDRDRID